MNDQLTSVQHICVSSRNIVAMTHYFSESKIHKKEPKVLNGLRKNMNFRLKDNHLLD